MDAASEVGYKPPPEFQEDAKGPLIGLNLTDSTELWLVQWPINQPPDFDGQEVSLNLHHDGRLGGFESSSGKSYDIISFAAEDPDATVFLSSSESKIVGKISRRVSLVHYPEPSELQKNNTNYLKTESQMTSGTSLTNSAHLYRTPTQGTRPTISHSLSGNAASTQDGRRRIFLPEVEEPSKAPKRKQVDARTLDQSTQGSGQGHSAVTFSWSLGHSQERKLKKKKRNDG